MATKGATSQTVLSPNELAKRWGLTTRSIRTMEQEGKLHRLPDLPGVKYSVAEVVQLESVGLEAQKLSAWERRNMQEKIDMLERLVASYQQRLAEVMRIAGGVQDVR